MRADPYVPSYGLRQAVTSESAQDRAHRSAPAGRFRLPVSRCCGFLGTTRTLDSHACWLRHKLGGGGDRFVVNVWGE